MDFANVWLWHGETQSAMSECISHSHSRFTAVLLPSVFPSKPNKALSQSFVCEGLGAPVRENHSPDLTGYFIVLFGCVKQAVHAADSLLWMVYSESAVNPFPSVPVRVWECAFLQERESSIEEGTGLHRRGKFYKVNSSQRQSFAVRGPVRFELYDVRKTKICT